MDTPDKASKRLVVYDRKDPKKYYSLDISNAQVWELEPEHSDWDPIDCFPRQTIARTLYRLESKQPVPGAHDSVTRSTKHWVLVEEKSHFEAGSLGPPTCQALTDIQAAEQLVLSGHTPPADVAHLVSDKMAPPPIEAEAVEAPNALSKYLPSLDRIGQLTEAEWLEIMASAGFLPPVKKFGPVRDDYSGEETTLFQYPNNRWILFINPYYQPAGKRSVAITRNEATKWFLDNGLGVEMPRDLYEFLPAPGERQTELLKESATASPEPGQAPAGHSPEATGQYVSENRHFEGTANPLLEKAPVVLSKYGEPVIVNGNPKEWPSLPAYKLVKALVEAGDKGLSKGQLEPISTDYWRILKGLKSSDPDWNEVIHFPGKPHGRYRIG